jgi:PAS domain S-box-containing protein
MKQYNDYRLVKFLGGILILIIILLFLFHYNSLNKNKDVKEAHMHAMEVINDMDECMAYIFDCETAENNYIITRDEKFLKRLEMFKEKTVATIRDIEEKNLNALEKIKVDSIKILLNKKFADWDAEINYARNNENEKLFEMRDKTKENLDKLEEKLYSLESLQNEMLGERNIAAKQEADFSFKTLTIGTSLIGLIILALFIMLSVEIKKRREKEFELFLSNEWHTKTLVSMGDGLVTTDEKGSITFLNRAAEKMTGWTNDEAKNKPIHDVFNIISSKTKLPVENPVMTALKENRIAFLEERTLLVKKDGTVINVNDSAAPVVGNDGNVIGSVLIFRDVTEQETNRKKLIKNERLLKDIIDNTTSLIIIKDTDSRFVLVNPQYEKVFDCKAADVIGKKHPLIQSEELRKKFMEEDNEVISIKKTMQYEDTLIHADGSIHYYHTVKFPLYENDGKVYGLCSVSTDITESKKNIEMREKLLMEKTLTKSEAKYTELTENLPNILFSLNHKMEFIHWNKACEEFTGRKAENIIGKKITEIATDISEGSFYSKCKEVHETAEIKKFHHYVQLNGKDYIFWANIYPTLQGISVLMYDVTEQKRAEQETLKLVERLQHRNKELKQFAYIVSHNLRAPISKIQGFASLFSGDTKRNEMLIKYLNEEAVNLDSIVIDLNTLISYRDSDAAERNHVFFETEVQLIKQVLDNEISRAEAEIHTSFDEAPEVYSIKSYVYSILFNLVSNAIKYRLPEKKCIIKVSTHKYDDFICLCVQDNGRGINLEKNGAKIFGLYKRFHEDAGIDGKGMGLHLVKVQAESLGGKVAVESKPGEGTTFKVFFPANGNTL